MNFGFEILDLFLWQIDFSLSNKQAIGYRLRFLIITLLGLWAWSASAQTIHGIRKPTEIPFEYYNDFIVIPVVFNKILPLNFIFDTGAEHTVLMKREIADAMGIPFEKRFRIIGSDMTQELYAYLIRRIQFQMNSIKIPNQSLLVLEEDYFEFEKRVGKDVHGIIGTDIFRAYRVQIDYVDKKIILSPSSPRSPGRGFRSVPVELNRHRPYLTTQVTLSDTTNLPVKLLLDTGAGLAMILHTDTHPDLSAPERVIPGEVGAGLGGVIEGFLGRTDELALKKTDLKLRNVVTHFQELNDDLDTTRLNARNGIIGNQVLRRFDVVLDYPREELYLKPNKYYKQKFKFDKSGLVLYAAGSNLNKYIVTKVIPGSPAAEADIRRGDRILRINGTASVLTNLGAILSKLKRKSGKKIKLVVEREGVKLKKRFVLRDLI